MGGENERNDFSKDRAELFEALGHPTRIKILQSLAGSPLGFSELKKRLDIESGGLLQFHLGKLQGLVKASPEGSYALTDEGKEALRSIVANADAGNHLSRKIDRNRTKILAVALTLSIIVSAGLAGFILQKTRVHNFETELDQVNFVEARISNITLYQNPSENEGMLEFRWQFYCRHPWGYPLSMVINNVRIQIDFPCGNVTSVVVDSPRYIYAVVATMNPYSKGPVSGTLFLNTSLGTANEIMEYLSANPIAIDQFLISAVFSDGAPFVSTSDMFTINPSPDQERRLGPCPSVSSGTGF